MAANTYDINDRVRLSVTFTVSSTPTDPTTVTLKVEDPSGNEATYTYALAQVTRDDTGDYHYDLTLDEAGSWAYRWEGTGTVTAAYEATMFVKASRF